MTDPDVRLTRALAELGAEHEPPPGWQARVLAAIEPPRSHRRWWIAAPIGALAAAAVMFWLVTHRPALILVVERSHGAARLRGDDYALGDRIEAVARGGERHHAIWVYRDGADLVAACPGGAACRSAGDGVTLAVTLDRTGSYQIVAWTGAHELPRPSGAYDADARAARATGGTSRTQELTVR